MSATLEQHTAASSETIAESAASIRRDIAISVWAFVWLPLPAHRGVDDDIPR